MRKKKIENDVIFLLIFLILACIITVFVSFEDFDLTKMKAAVTNRFTVTVNRSLFGLITSNIVGADSKVIKCGADYTGSIYGDCIKQFRATSIKLSPTPLPGYSFKRWSGCNSVSGNICIVSETKTVTPLFVKATTTVTPTICSKGQRMCVGYTAENKKGKTDYVECVDDNNDGKYEWSATVKTCSLSTACGYSMGRVNAPKCTSLQRPSWYCTGAGTCTYICKNDPSCNTSGSNNECTLGQRKCDGTTGYKECIRYGSGTRWSSKINCLSGQTCSNGSCTTTNVSNGTVRITISVGGSGRGKIVTTDGTVIEHGESTTKIINLPITEDYYFLAIPDETSVPRPIFLKWGEDGCDKSIDPVTGFSSTKCYLYAATAKPGIATINAKFVLPCNMGGQTHCFNVESKMTCQKYNESAFFYGDPVSCTGGSMCGSRNTRWYCQNMTNYNGEKSAECNYTCY